MAREVTTVAQTMPSVRLPLGERRARGITLRAVLLGIVGVLIICALTPYNDWALENTYVVGNNLPLGVIILLVVFALFINAPLSYWLPHRAFSASELAVAFSMVLVSCTVPSSDLMRYLMPAIVS